MNKGKKITVTRRAFITNLSITGTVLAFTLYSCKNFFRSKKTSELVYGDKEKSILNAVLLHLFPSEPEGPGASELKAGNYLSWIINDPNIALYKKELLISGIHWAEETAIERFQQSFVALSKDQKEETLRDLENYSNGRRWLSSVLNYILEALLGDPIYGSNTNESGWKWLGHIPGYPRPREEQKYLAQ